MVGYFAVYHTWPDIKNAEYEVIQRIIIAGNNIGLKCVVIDNNGCPLWWSRGLNFDKRKPISGRGLQFVISLHFESPNVIDAYSYITLWQPTEFYHTFGYDQSITKVRSHNDLLSCSSDHADAHGRNIFRSLGRAPELPLLNLFHNTAEPYLPPNVSENSRLFYIGINWERVGKPKGRFHDTLMALNERGIVDIYGPELFLGVAPWEGFASYAGEVPFDGRSTQTAINKSGICLALSSTAHKNSGIMSNRLFEGFTGGAAVIATPNAFIDKFFKDVVYEVDDSGSEVDIASRIADVVREIRRNHKEANERVEIAQKRISENFSLERSLSNLIAKTPDRMKLFYRQCSIDCEITVIVVIRSCDEQTLRDKMDMLFNQSKCRINVAIICDRDLRDATEDQIKPQGAVVSVTFYERNFNPSGYILDGPCDPRQRSGEIIFDIISKLSDAYFAILSDECSLFSDHFTTVAGAISRQVGAVAGCSGVIVEEIDATNAPSRRLGDAGLDSPGVLYQLGTSQHSGRFLFSSALFDRVKLEPSIFSLLDGHEHLFFRLAAVLEGPIACSHYHTYLHQIDAGRHIPDPAEKALHQNQFIRDHFFGDPRYQDGLLRYVGKVEHVYAYSPGSPIRWENYQSPYNSVVVATVNRMYPVGLGSIGQQFLGDGFSYPEADGVWIEGPVGVLSLRLSNDADSGAPDFELCLLVEGRNSLVDNSVQDLAVKINGALIGYQTVPTGEKWLRFRIPRRIAGRTSSFRIELHPGHSEMGYDDQGKVIDGRRMSIKVRALAIENAYSATMKTLQYDEEYLFRQTGNGVELLGEGFFAPEEFGAWMAGTEATLQFRLPADNKPKILSLLVAGRRRNTSGEPQLIRLTVGDVKSDWVAIGEQQDLIKLVLDESSSQHNLVVLKIEVSHAEAVVSAFGSILDGRALGAAIYSVRLLDATPWPACVADKPLARMNVDELTAFGSQTAMILFKEGTVSAPDGDIRFIQGRAASLAIKPPANVNGATYLWLTVSGPPVANSSQLISVGIGGIYYGETALGMEFVDLIIKAPSTFVSDFVEIDISCRYVGESLPYEHNWVRSHRGVRLGKIGWVTEHFVDTQIELGAPVLIVDVDRFDEENLGG
ncbi:glycosyltransferase [Allorhizobium pseudoryzae]|uniref:glycosyltransferase n=1 Tax=Allorhizobium pseudoryzae TaxID=379684 RepID=UPI003D027FE2